MTQEALTCMPIYLDNAATTKLAPEVLEAMLPWLTQQFGNPASVSHCYGWQAQEAVEQARVQVASLIGAQAREIVFTSGATEADNLAIAGVAKFHQDKGRHIITVATEHKAVLDTCAALQADGYRVTYLPVDEFGILQPEKLAQAIAADTILVSVMMVNNETGVIQDIAALSAICKARGVLLHTDAVQASGRLAIDVNKLDVDLMSLSAHKSYGPKGIGALYIRQKPRVRLAALIHGGGHERGMRSGTLATHQIVGMGAAYALAQSLLDSEPARIAALRDQLWDGIKDMPGVYLNGHPEKRVANILNTSVAYVEGQSLLMSMPELAISSGSACTSASIEPSHVLKALGRSPALAHSSLRLSLGRYTSAADIQRAIAVIRQQVQRLRAISPLGPQPQSSAINNLAGAY